MNDAVVSKSDEGEMLVMKAGVLCWAKSKEIVSWWLEILGEPDYRKDEARMKDIAPTVWDIAYSFGRI